MSNNNIILSYPNRADAATFSGGTWLSELPVSNLANRELWKVARSTNAALGSTKFTVDFGVSRLLRCFALANHNMSADAKFLVKVFNPESTYNLATGSDMIFDRAYWVTAENLLGTYTCSEATVRGPFYDNTVSKFVSVISSTLLIRKIISLPPGTYAISIYVYVPYKHGINNWGMFVDAQDVEISSTFTSSIFDSWVRVTNIIEIASTRSFIDFSFVTNGLPLQIGDTVYVACAQIESGSVVSTYKPTTSTISNLALVWSSGWQNAWQLTFDNLVEWESATWWIGTAGDEYYRSPYPAMLAMPDFITGRYITVEIDDTANPDGYVQIGRLFAGGGIQLATNASYGLQDSWRDLSSMDMSEGGSAWGTDRRRLRGVSFVIDHLTLSEAAYIHEMQRLLGTVNEVLYLPYPDDIGESQRYGFVGRLSELSAIEYPYFNARSSAFKLEEIG